MELQTREAISKVVPQSKGDKVTMANYTGKQSVLDEALGEYAQCGFKLTEPDDLHLDLYFKGRRIAVYNQPKATVEIIREGCRNFLNNITRSL